MLSIAVRAALAYARPVVRSTVRMASSSSSSDSLGRGDVCVLGGGFGGLYTALRLSGLDWGGAKPRITLVDRSDRFVFLPMLYELATGSVACWEVAPPFEEVLAGSGVEFVQADVRSLDTAARMVGVAEAGGGGLRHLPYDQCVLALGAEPVVGAVPGAAEHALPFYGLDDALALRRKLKALAAEGGALRVTVVGGGYVGVELAANLAAWLPPSQLQLTLVHRAGELVDASPLDFNRAAAADRLRDAGVDVRLRAEVERVTPDGATVRAAAGGGGGEGAAGEEIGADVVVWTAGSRPSSLLPELGLPLDEGGRLRVGPTLQLDGSDALFALGDAARGVDAAGAAPPSTAQAAIQQADYAAWNVRAAMRNERMLPYRYANLGEMLSFGGADAALSSLGLLELKGPLAAASRRAVYAARMPTAKQAAKVGASWAIDAAINTALGAIAAANKASKKE